MTAAVTAPPGGREPGVYAMSADEYHLDEALSSSGVKKLLPPSCPALYRWERDNGQAHKKHFDFGHAVHKLALGAGADIVVVEADAWRTKDAKQQRADAYAAGKIPLLTEEHERAQTMVAALRAHPLASALLDPATGVAEQCVFWRDHETGIMRRAMFDFLRTDGGGRPTIVDLKSADKVDPASLERALVNFNYAGQADWYRDGAVAAEVAPDDVAFVFIAQMKEPPYLVHVFQPDDDAYAYGRAVNRRAIEVFAACLESGVWPGFAGDFDIPEISVPRWADRLLEDL